MNKTVLLLTPSLIFLWASQPQFQDHPVKTSDVISLTATLPYVATNSDFKQLEEEIVADHNLARTNPSRYADLTAELLGFFDGDVIRRPDEPGLITTEGPAAVREAVQFLRNAEPMGPVTLSRGMSHGALDLVEDHGPTGTTGHVGSDGSQLDDRVERYGDWTGRVGENAAYGPYENGNGRRVVMSLIIDDGVSSRGHRDNIFNGAFNVVGVACGPHANYGTICVIDYAVGYEEH